jgi:uncharacterized protein YdaU (DUF1376 family)
MYYYQFNIGDYASHTRNLSLLEDLAYRRLLDEYYLHEHPLSASVTDVARQIGFRDHEDSVKFVLDTFFVMTDKGYINPRADKEISHFHSKIAQASNAGKASAQRRLNARSTDVQPTNNQQPITNNHKPNNNTSGVRFDEFWNAYPASGRKTAKVTCREKWVKRNLDEFADKIIGHVNALKKSDQWLKGYDPSPLTYINQSRWEDDVVEKKDFWEGRRVI